MYLDVLKAWASMSKEPWYREQAGYFGAFVVGAFPVRRRSATPQSERLSQRYRAEDNQTYVNARLAAHFGRLALCDRDEAATA